MSADPWPGWRPWRSQPQEEEEDPGPRTGPGARLGEPGKYAYAALCAISLASLFPDLEESAYRTGVVENLVRWLELSDAVMPSMLAFAGGLGAEGTETFARILLGETLLKDQPGAIMLDLVSFSLKDGYYDARMRVLLSHVACLLRIPLAELEDAEDYLLECLKEEKEAESETDEGKRKKKERRKKLKRYLLIGLATVGGGTVIGLTGGLAAPLVGMGAAAIIGTAGATALGSAAGMAIIGSLFGAAGAGLVGYKMKKRVGAIEEFEFLPLTEVKQLHITIAITGWLSPGKYGIVTALTWPASLLAVAGVIDNPWGVCLHRSAEVGKHLAQILLSRRQGKRPVTLVGFSLGARVIYFCLQEMAKEKDCEGIIEDVVLLGAPVEGDPKSWKLITKVISGKIINGFCRGDWLLKFVYRTSSIQLSVAGLQPICLDDRRMVNVDLSSVVNGHLDYMKQMDTILKAVGLKTRPALQERGGLLAAPSAPSEEEEKEGMSPDGTTPEEPSVLGRPDVGGPAEGEDLQGNEDSWCWEPVSAPGQACEVSPAKDQSPETLPSSSPS
ncbi:transmembrane and coiled-coil domain-containing protein 4 isoform X2 [Crotalus tigris]|uniref:transmembrane and coiled-coil domain-containing protein 4 isoform X2 n=1 Tax=Crotalus tigris TaxID=88082 RepID=UPI00192F9412|nr:transmembrane and coiled-coil domain-containing protein 4 isoform X2 [Crotalus tigris]